MKDAVSWTDACQALAAITAVVASIVAVVLSALAYRREARKDDRTLKWEEARQKREERAEQADLVAAWSHKGVQPVMIGDRELPGRTTIKRGAQVVNNSQVPVYDVVVTFHRGAAPLGTVRAALTPPGTTFVSWPKAMREDAALADDFASIAVALRFRDAGGRVWVRNTHGELKFDSWAVSAAAASRSTSSGTVEVRHSPQSPQTS